MLTVVNPSDSIAIWRLLELLSDRTAWHRSLWGIGVILAMDELFEACIASKQGHLSEGSIKRMASALQRRFGAHPAFSDAEKQFLRLQVQHIPKADSPAHFALRDLSRRLSADYLARWGRAVATGTVAVEHFSRSVAAHLLDAGFSGPYLWNFIKARLDVARANLSLALASRSEPLACVDLLEGN